MVLESSAPQTQFFLGSFFPETPDNTSGLHSVQWVQCGFARQGDDRESSQSGDYGSH